METIDFLFSSSQSSFLYSHVLDSPCSLLDPLAFTLSLAGEERSEDGKDQVRRGGPSGPHSLETRRKRTWKRYYRRRKGRWKQEEVLPLGGSDGGGGGGGGNSHEDLNRRARRSLGPQASSRRSWETTTSTHFPRMLACRLPRSVSLVAVWAPRWLLLPPLPSTWSRARRRRIRSRWEESMLPGTGT